MLLKIVAPRKRRPRLGFTAPSPTAEGAEPPVDGFIYPPQSQVGEQIRVSAGVPSIGTNPRVSGAGYNP
jgi:hypothetical protein